MCLAEFLNRSSLYVLFRQEHFIFCLILLLYANHLTENNINIHIFHNRLLSPISYYPVSPMLHKTKEANDYMSELYRGVVSCPEYICDKDMLPGYIDSM